MSAPHAAPPVRWWEWIVMGPPVLLFMGVVYIVLRGWRR